MKIDMSQKLPIKMWLEDLEVGALFQVHNLANLPFAFHHIALMPDAHTGYGMPIGGVMATKGVVVPNAVGVDIGCGMYVIPTGLRRPSIDELKKILGLIRERIPVGFNRHRIARPESLMPKVSGKHMPIVDREYFKARSSLGTLGGGNHFIELQLDAQGYLWIMIHSGSRNLGKQVADHYNKVAKRLNEKWYSGVPSSVDLAFLPLESPEGQSYLDEMDFCVSYAMRNRQDMMNRVLEVLKEVYTNQFSIHDPINIAHNYARMEHHYGKDVMIHRKGATSAKLGEVGVIPGSQGSSSFIVEGLGNHESFTSCSHGAGRKMGRKQARRTLSLADEQASMAGILHSIRGEKDLDEAPGAYKDIEVVMECQQDLVNIQYRLQPIAVVKG